MLYCQEIVALTTRAINAEENCKQFESEYDRLKGSYTSLQSEGMELHKAYLTRQQQVEALHKTIQEEKAARESQVALIRH